MTHKSDKTSRPDTGADVPATELHDDSFTLLRSIRRSLAHLLRQIESGDVGALKGLMGRTGELEKALRLAIETEVKFTEWKAQYDRSLAENEIDFEAVRFEIGCRLARIRDCCDEGRISQGVIGG